jgi:hypothetical protein
MKRRPSAFPPHIHRVPDQSGKLRTAFRRGATRVTLPYPPLTVEWWGAYRQALADDLAGRAPGVRSAIGAARVTPGSVRAGFVAYSGSTSFRNGLAPSTQRVHGNILRRLVDAAGELPIRYIE